MRIGSPGVPIREKGRLRLAPELLELGLSVPQVTKIFLKLR